MIVTDFCILNSMPPALSVEVQGTDTHPQSPCCVHEQKNSRAWCCHSQYRKFFKKQKKKLDLCAKYQKWSKPNCSKINNRLSLRLQNSCCSTPYFNILQLYTRFELKFPNILQHSSTCFNSVRVFPFTLEGLLPF
ncbi:unnamed protein product [Caretta caretta]